MIKSDKKLKSFVWKNNTLNDQINDLQLTIKQGHPQCHNDIVKLLQANAPDYHRVDLSVDPKDYMILLNKDKLIAAARFTYKQDVFQVDDIIIHPMYPENATIHGFYLMLQSCGARLPINN